MSDASGSPVNPANGLVAGKYEVLRVLGRGGMGSVWEGRHATLGTRVAIKFIDAEYADSVEARSRFANEARAAATIESKHAIHIYDHGLTGDGRPYIVMELLTGEPLDKRLDAVGRIPLGETARLLGQVCRALQRAHDAGVTHRDLKPENIFLVRTPDDDEDFAKVLDFGIAKIKGASGEKSTTSSTKTGAVMGTPFYMSPEQARGLRTVDYRTDLWSLGVIAYRCVTGAMPFDGESVGDLLVKVCTAPLPVPSAVTPGIPRAFDAWFAKALAREPDVRFQTALELAEALALAAGMSVGRGTYANQQTPEPAATSSPAQGAEARTPGPPSEVAPTLDSASISPLAPQAAGLTSAPFVTSKAPPTTTKRNLIVFVAVGCLALGIGGMALLKVVFGGEHAKAAAESAASPAQAKPPTEAKPTSIPPSSTPPSSASEQTSAPPAASTVRHEALANLPSPNKPLSAPGTWMPAVHGPTKAAPSAKSASSTPSSVVAAPPAPLPVPVVTAAPAPVPKPKPAPATDDPGY